VQALRNTDTCSNELAKGVESNNKEQR